MSNYQGLSIVSVNMPFINSGNTPTELKFSVVRHDNIVDDNPSLYDVFVSRWYLDSSLVESFRISSTNQTDYWMGVKANGDGDNYGIRKSYLPTCDKVQLYGEQDFLDQMNHSINNAYTNYGLEHASTSLNYGLSSATATGTFTQDTPHVDFAVPSLAYPDEAYDYHLTINSIVVNTDAPNVDFSLSLFNQTIDLQIMVSRNNFRSLAGKSFADWAAYDIDNDDHLLKQAIFKPVSAFFQFKNKPSNAYGLYSLMLTPNTSGITYSFTVNYTLDVVIRKSTPEYSYPTFAPVIQLDQSTKLLQWFYSTAWRASNYDIYVSPKIFAMIGFPGSYVASELGYKLRFPQAAFTEQSQVDMITYPQAISTVECLCDIESIGISTSMPIAHEVNALGFKSSNRILTSFIVDSYSKTSYSFTATADNLRKFRILQTSPLTNFDISFFIKRKNNDGDALNQSQEVVNLLPGMYGDILLQFIPATDNQFGNTNVGGRAQSNAFR
jgi:hypothetical protein